MKKILALLAALIVTGCSVGTSDFATSLDDRAISKVDGKIIYQNSDGQYYTMDASGRNGYLVKGEIDPTPLDE